MTETEEFKYLLKRDKENYDAGWKQGYKHGAWSAAPQVMRNFCKCCGKRLSKHLDHIHTCTPPID